MGRCHAQLGEDRLAVAALDAALKEAKDGRLLMSESLAVRSLALVAKGARAKGGANIQAHWSESTGRQRLSEVMGRMAGEEELLGRLLLRGL